MAKDLYDMTDEELEEAFRSAKEELSNGTVSFQEDTGNDVDNTISDVDVENDEITGLDDITNTEQPNVDSDDNSNEENVENVEVDNSEKLDGDNTEQVEAAIEDTEPEVQEVQKYKVKANGQEFDFTLNELQLLAPKAMDYTKKMQELSPWRKTISALKDNHISQDDVNLMIDVLKGDKNAIASIMKRTGLDALEIDTENVTYQPKNYGRDEVELAVNDIISKYESDPEFSITADIISSKWDDSSRSEFFKDVRKIEQLHVDVKNGDYKPVFAEAQKLKALDDGRHNDMYYYIQAGKNYHMEKTNQNIRQQQLAIKQQQQIEATKAREVELQKVQQTKEQAKARAVAEKQAELRKAAAPTKAVTSKSVVDYLDDSDEKYEEWYRNLKANQ